MNEATKVTTLLASWCVGLSIIAGMYGPITGREFVLISIFFFIGALGFFLLQVYGFVWQLPLRKITVNEVN